MCLHTSYGLYLLLFQLAQEYHPFLDLHGVLELQDPHTDQEHLQKQITKTLTCIQAFKVSSSSKDDLKLLKNQVIPGAPEGPRYPGAPGRPSKPLSPGGPGGPYNEKQKQTVRG